MKKYLLLSALLLTSLSATFVSCKKDEPQKSRKELIVGTWTVKGVGADANQNGSLEASEYDSLYKALNSVGGVATQTFVADGNGQIKATALGRILTDMPFSWSLQNNDQTLRLKSSIDTNFVDATITKLDGSQLEFQQQTANVKTLFVLSK